jgi:hypothetical protein
MSLVPCRACSREVDTSAIACPQCGATDPGKKISRQERNLRVLVAQTVIWLCILGFGGWYVAHKLIPMVGQYIGKPPPEQTAQTQK